MAKKMELNELDDLFAQGKDFTLTASQYQERIGKPLPKSVSGITGTNAPLTRKARKNGYIIEAVIEQPVITRTVVFKKVEEEERK